MYACVACLRPLHGHILVIDWPLQHQNYGPRCPRAHNPLACLHTHVALLNHAHMDLLPHTAHMAQTGQARTALCTWPQRRSRQAHNALCAVPDRRSDQAHTALRACLEHGSGHAHRALCAWQDRWPGQPNNALCAWTDRWGQTQTVLCPSPDRLSALSYTMSTYITSARM